MVGLKLQVTPGPVSGCFRAFLSSKTLRAGNLERDYRNLQAPLVKVWIGHVRQVDIDETRYPELIINLAKNTDFLSRADVIQLLHVSPSKAYTLLKKLVAQGVLEPVNKGHYAKYRYVGNR